MRCEGFLWPSSLWVTVLACHYMVITTPSCGQVSSLLVLRPFLLQCGCTLCIIFLFSMYIHFEKKKSITLQVLIKLPQPTGGGWHSKWRSFCRRWLMHLHLPPEGDIEMMFNAFLDGRSWSETTHRRPKGLNDALPCMMCLTLCSWQCLYLHFSPLAAITVHREIIITVLL